MPFHGKRRHGGAPLRAPPPPRPRPRRGLPVARGRPAPEARAADRAHRIGQTEDVNVYQVVAKDTIEERILELQHTKSELARQFTDASPLADETGTGTTVFAEAPASIATLTRDDLLDLLG